MLDALKFAQGAMKMNAITPELEYYQIKNGRVMGYNGHMALSAPIDLELEAKPKAVLFHKAIQSCGETIAMGMTDGGRLSIRSGTFRAYLPCTEAPIYEAQPEGEVFPGIPGLAEWCKKLLPIVSQDASRPWAMGMNLSAGTLQVTNNVSILQVWTGHSIPSTTIPRFAVAELARIKEDPASIQVSPSSVTFHFADGRWLRTQVLSDEWPAELVNNIFEKATEAAHGHLPAIPAGLFEGLETIKAFVPAETTKVTFEDGILVTGSEGAGASIEIEGLPAGPSFSSKVMGLLDGLMTNAAFHAQPCLFTGPDLRGVILGMN